MILPKPDECLCLQTNASNKVVSAILETTAGKPVYFYSRVLSDSEKRLDVVKNENLSDLLGTHPFANFFTFGFYLLYILTTSH